MLVKQLRVYMKYFYALTALLLCFCSNIALAEISVPKASSYSGRHFYVGFMQNEILGGSQSGDLLLRIFVTSIAPANVTVKFPGSSPVTHKLGLNDVKEIIVDAGFENRNSELITDKLVEISSDIPVSCFAFSSRQTTSDAYSVIPVSRWGNEHVAICFPNDQYDDPDRFNLDSLTRYEPRSSEFLVMAAYDSTVIEFAPTAPTRNGISPGVSTKVVLDKGKCYLVQAARSVRGKNDLTGTIVKSNKPVGFLSGHMRTAVLQGIRYPYDSKDHLVEMLAATHTWGKDFYSIPFELNNNGDLFRLTSVKPYTIVYKETSAGVEEIYLNTPGAYYEVVRVNEPVHWRATEPIQICQFMTHYGTDAGDNQDYDPAMVVVPPVEQYVQYINFLTPRNYDVQNQYAGHKIGLIVDDLALKSLRLDNAPISDYSLDIQSKKILNTKYHYANIMVREGRHVITCNEGFFSGTLFGYGFRDSYAMAFGNGLTDPEKIDSIAPNLSVKVNCGKISGFISDIHDSNSSGIDYVMVNLNKTYNYKWNIPNIADTATVATFTAEPEDIHGDAYFEITIYDKNSKATKYSYQYIGTSIATPSDLQFFNINWKNKVCQTVVYKNNSKKPVTLESLNIKTDKRFSLVPEQSIPHTFAPGESMKVDVCFEPNGDSAKVKCELIADFDCDLVYKASIVGNVYAPAIIVDGKDFGKIRIGDKVCDSIYITNKGNVNAKINDLNINIGSSTISLDKAGKLPVILKPGEKVGFYVCFIPDSLKNYKMNVQVLNDQNLDLSCDVTGEGVAPDVSSIFIDWGKKRIGTKNDTLVYLKNTGSFTCKLDFVKIVAGDPKYSDIIEIQKIKNKTLNPGDSIEIKMHYYPTDISNFNYKLELKADWAPHKIITIEAIGSGTIPTIKTNNFRFDTTRILTTRDSSFIAINPGGNEWLTIDSVYVISKNTDSIKIDLSIFKNIKIPNTEDQVMKVHFAPTRLGEHKIVLGVVNDALPNYKRKTDTITISGYCIPADTISMEYETSVPEINACVHYNGFFKIRNKGNVYINIQDLKLTRIPDNFIADWTTDVASLLPMKILPGDSAVFPMKFFAENKQGGKLYIDAKMNDSVSKRFEFDMIPKVETLTMAYNFRSEFTPGDTIKLNLNGDIPAIVDENIDFKINVFMDYMYLNLLNKNTEIVFLSKTGEKRIPVVVNQLSDRLEIKFPTDSLANENIGKWSISLDFLGLLTSNSESKIKIEVSADRCFEENIIEFPIKIIDVCTFPLRPIKLITNLQYAFVTPMPVNNKLNIEIKLEQDEQTDIWLSDVSGKKYLLSQNLFLKKGKHSLIFDIGNEFTSGTYFLTISSMNMKYSNKIIITK